VDFLEQLREDAWKRWQNCFDRLSELDEASRSGERVIYTNSPQFDLKQYTPRKFPAGGRTFKVQPMSVNFTCHYRIDGEGRPVYMASRHTVNRIDWQGFFRYTADEAEYVEFCVQTGVVAKYARLTLRDGVNRTYQCIVVNGGGSHIGGRTGRRAMEYIPKDPFLSTLQVEDYEASGNRIVSGSSLAEVPGGMSFRSTLEYSYSQARELERIVSVGAGGTKTTVFAAKSKSGIKELAAGLSEKIAARTLEALSKAKYSAPLQVVALSFRSVTNYVPMIIPATELDAVSSMNFALSTEEKNWIELNYQEFEPEMEEFLERMRTAENWKPGAQMLRKAALMVTKLAPGSLNVADGFVAYAIDAEFEWGKELEILKECGATAATLKKLRKLGWLK